jgi:hypothetical protein
MYTYSDGIMTIIFVIYYVFQRYFHKYIAQIVLQLSPNDRKDTINNYMEIKDGEIRLL